MEQQTEKEPLEALAERWKQAGVNARVRDGKLYLKSGAAGKQVQALVFPDFDHYRSFCASMESRAPDLLEQQTAYLLEAGPVHLFIRCAAVERSQVLPSGVQILADDEGQDHEFDSASVLFTGDPLPKVKSITPEDWALIQEVAAEPKRELAEEAGQIVPPITTEPKPKQQDYPVMPMTSRTPPILGATWWTKLAGLDRVAILVAVRMAQLAQKDKDGNWHAYASQNQLARLIGCKKPDTIRVAWRKLEKVGYLHKKPGTGQPGVTSEFTVFGLGFPNDRKKKQS